MNETELKIKRNLRNKKKRLTKKRANQKTIIQKKDKEKKPKEKYHSILVPDSLWNDFLRLQKTAITFVQIDDSFTNCAAFLERLIFESSKRA